MQHWPILPLLQNPLSTRGLDPVWAVDAYGRGKAKAAERVATE